MALSFTTISGDGRHSLASTNSGFNSNSDMDEEEVDQLNSELDDDEEDDMEPEVEEEESASAVKGRRKLGVRIPGHTLVPQDRLDNILQAEGSGPHMSKEAIYMLSIATEEFVKKLAEAGYQQTVSENRQHVQYRDMANVAHKRKAYKFLEDTVPKPISIAEAMQRRAAKERELLQDDPAISATAPPSPPFPPTQLVSAPVNANTKAQPKARQSLPAPRTNGTETNGSVSAASTPAASTNASASAAGRGSRQRDRRGRWSNGPSANGSHEGTPVSTAGAETRAGSARIRNRSTRAREAAEAAHSHGRGSHANGTSSAHNGLSSSNDTASAGAHPDHWPAGQAVGPASGYMDEGNLLAANGRNPMTDNPGRTIYSQQRPSTTQPR
ncbi:hypothetical protein C8Q80DRAFT_1093608 [Daedaleopsis nitida]|nr:hypothetical protein C8Q80DRAFT_1093608 [Daedaleopsis nitida]